MRYSDGDNLAKNLETLAKLKVGEKIGFEASRGRFTRHGLLQGLKRSLSGDSVLDKHDTYKNTLVSFFQEAAQAYREGRVSLPLLHAAMSGLQTQVQTYANKEADEAKWGSKDAYQRKINSTLGLIREVVPIRPVMNGVEHDPTIYIPVGADDLPSLKEWQAATANAVQKPTLERLGKLLKLCHRHGAFTRALDSKFSKFYLYGDLYFTADYWLKEAGEGHQPGRNAPSERNKALDLMGRGPAYAMVYRIYLTVVRRLCRAFRISVNVLPQKLITFFGKQIDECNRKADARNLAADELVYLQRAEAQKYKLVFRSGLAYQYPWWSEEAGEEVLEDLVLAESNRAVELDTIFNYGGREIACFDGAPGSCVLSMSREVFMYAHRTAGMMGHPQAFCHSSYLRGEPVLVAGAMGIIQGQVVFINTMSGHYRPTSDKMLNFLECLVMHDVNLEDVKVAVMERINGQLEDNVYLARPFLHKRGKMARGDRQRLGVG